jgi:hypothetical protein
MIVGITLALTIHSLKAEYVSALFMNILLSKLLAVCVKSPIEVDRYRIIELRDKNPL